MLRDELETALNDLIVAARESADGYGKAATVVGSQHLNDFFAAAAERRRTAAAALEDEQRKLGHLPKAKDEEQALVRGLATQVKATLAADEAEPLLRERCDDESRIVEACQALLALDLPASLRTKTQRLMTEAQSRRQRLRALAGPD